MRRDAETDEQIDEHADKWWPDIGKSRRPTV